MQYILTEKEYKSLVPKQKLIESENKVEKLNQMVLEYSEYTCCYDMGGFGYCDICPIQFSCSKPKNYSK